MRLKAEFTEEHRESAMKKITQAALHFEGNSTSVEFKDIVGIRLTPLEFKLFIEKTFALRLSPPEVCSTISFSSSHHSSPCRPLLSWRPSLCSQSLRHLPPHHTLSLHLHQSPHRLSYTRSLGPTNCSGAMSTVASSSPPSSSSKSKSRASKEPSWLTMQRGGRRCSTISGPPLSSSQSNLAVD
jgi:hypothetical protein